MKDFRNILRRELKSNVGNTVKGFVGELIEGISFHLEKRGIKSSDADDIARGVVDALRESMGGGCQLYFPKLNRKDNSERDAEILREYKRGAFVNELAIKHNVSLQTIYCAIKKARERHNDDDDDQ
ncbi:hypothetical protein OE880_001444 [Salmonella enterica]|nr:hypothetical protein [Salmonella enterica]